MRFRSLLSIILLVCAAHFSAWAQPSKGGSPASFALPDLSATFHSLVFSKPDLSAVTSEDLLRDKYGMFYRAGLSVKVDAGLDNAGTWEELPNGDRIWRMMITVPDALAIGVYYDRFLLPAGGRLYLYDVNGEQIKGAYTEENNPESGYFATELTKGETVILEYYEPSRTRGLAKINVSEIAYMYRGVAYQFKDLKDYGDSESCEVDINCPEGANWQDEKKAVARIFLKVGAMYGWCTGSLLNNVREDCTPYFLTADHCGDGASTADLNQWMFYFNYEAPTCNYTGSEPSSNTITGCQLRAHGGSGGSTGSDFYLVEFNTSPTFNPYFNGWDRNNTAATGGVGIHHPAGDIQKISTFTGTLVSDTWGSVPNTHWRVVWTATVTDHGVTEGGSSGSPIFNNNGHIVGDLTGGGSYCSTPNSPDLYGKFSYSWDQNGTTAADRLKDWLDPDNTGVTTLDGSYCGGGSTLTANFTASATAIPVGGTVDFTDLTSGTPTSWSWTFTGGTPGTETTQHPAGIQYNTAGVYTVSLTASDGTNTDTETKTAYITVGDPPPVANFTANVTTIPVGGSVDFTDLSTGNPTSWAWSFTGGSPTTSTQQNPAGIIYNTAGVYSVSLTASNLNGSDVETKYNYIFVGTNPGDSGCDTLNYPLPGTEVLYSVYFGGGTYGYISGNNGYSDQAKANYFVPGSPYVKLVGGWFKFGKGTKRSSADAEIIFAAWDASGPGGSPGTTPIATDTLLISSIIQQVNTHNLTYIEFNPPINISSPFYLGVFLPEIGGDTLAVLTNKNGETIPGAAWEQWQNGLWYNYSDPVSWGYNLSHAIFPRMCKQDYSVGEGSGLENIIVYPNPADQVVTIDFGNVMYSNISVQLFDVIGQRCGTYMHNGDPLQSFNVDLKDRDAGIYFLRIQAGSDVVSRKITIIK